MATHDDSARGVRHVTRRMLVRTVVRTHACEAPSRKGRLARLGSARGEDQPGDDPGVDGGISCAHQEHDVCSAIQLWLGG